MSNEMKQEKEKSTEQPIIELTAEVEESSSLPKDVLNPEDIEALVNDVLNITADSRPKAEIIDTKLETLEGEIVDDKSSEPQTDSDKEDLEQVSEPSAQLVSSSIGMIKGLVNHLSSDKFVERCEELGEKHKLPPKVIAKNFCLRLIGMIGDCLDVAINVTRNFVKSTIDLLLLVLSRGVDLICDVAQGLVRVITLNQTARQQA